MLMNIEINSLEKQMLIAGLRLLEAQSVDVVEAGKISQLLQKIEFLKPSDRRIAVMDEEGRLFVEGEEMSPSELGF